MAGMTLPPVSNDVTVSEGSSARRVRPNSGRRDNRIYGLEIFIIDPNTGPCHSRRFASCEDQTDDPKSLHMRQPETETSRNHQAAECAACDQCIRPGFYGLLRQHVGRIEILRDQNRYGGDEACHAKREKRNGPNGGNDKLVRLHTCRLWH